MQYHSGFAQQMFNYVDNIFPRCKNKLIWYKGAISTQLSIALQRVKKTMRGTTGIFLFMALLQFVSFIKAKYQLSSFSVEAVDQPIKRWRSIPQGRLVNIPMFLPAIGTSFFLCSSGYTGGPGSWSKRCVEKMKRMAHIF